MFDNLEDKAFFEKLLCDDSTTIGDYSHFFDFRPVNLKRKEFNQVRKRLFSELTQKYGFCCFLKYPQLCSYSSGFAIDHLIPLATNQLNKALRDMKSSSGKKVVSQSFGSNHIDNLIIACNNCNNHKKHRLLDKETLTKILASKLAM